MRAVRIVVAVVCLVAVGAGVVLVATASTDSTDCAAFRIDPTRWKNGLAGDTPTDRQKISDRILECRTVIGWSRSRVRKALGRPDSPSPGYWDYVIGDERDLFVLDSESLSLHFRHGRVVKAEIVQG